MADFYDDGSDWSHTYETAIYGYLAAIKLLQIAAFDKSLGHAARRVLSIIAGYSNKDGYAFPSNGEIAKNLGISRQAVIKQVNALVKARYISLSRRTKDGGGNASNMYRLNFSLAEEYRKKPFAYEGLG